jgi:Tfp pilus assembly protein PilP
MRIYREGAKRIIAERLTPDTMLDVFEWLSLLNINCTLSRDNGECRLVINEPGCVNVVNAGEYIIHDNGRIYAMTSDEFMDWIRTLRDAKARKKW